jgi:hypothetical protein
MLETTMGGVGPMAGGVRAVVIGTRLGGEKEVMLIKNAQHLVGKDGHFAK